MLLHECSPPAVAAAFRRSTAPAIPPRTVPTLPGWSWAFDMYRSLAAIAPEVVSDSSAFGADLVSNCFERENGTRRSWALCTVLADDIGNLYYALIARNFNPGIARHETKWAVGASGEANVGLRSYGDCAGGRTQMSPRNARTISI